MLIRMVLGTLRSDRGVLVVLGALLLLVALLACTGAALMARLAGAEPSAAPPDPAGSDRWPDRAGRG